MFFEWPHPSSVIEQKKCQGSNADMINLALEYETYRFKFSLNHGPNLSLEVFSVNSPPTPHPLAIPPPPPPSPLPPPTHTHTHTHTHTYTHKHTHTPELKEKIPNLCF